MYDTDAGPSTKEPLRVLESQSHSFLRQHKYLMWEQNDHVTTQLQRGKITILDTKKLTAVRIPIFSIHVIVCLPIPVQIHAL